MKILKSIVAAFILLSFSCQNNSKELDDCIAVINKHRKAMNLNEIKASSSLHRINKKNIKLIRNMELAFGISEDRKAQDAYRAFVQKYLSPTEDYNIGVRSWKDEMLKEDENANATMDDFLIEINYANKIDTLLTEYRANLDSLTDKENYSNVYLKPNLISFDISRENKLLNEPEYGTLTIHSNGGVPTLTSFASMAFQFSNN